MFDIIEETVRYLRDRDPLGILERQRESIRLKSMKPPSGHESVEPPTAFHLNPGWGIQ